MDGPVCAVLSELKLEGLLRAYGHVGDRTLRKVGALARKVGAGSIKWGLVVRPRNWGWL